MTQTEFKVNKILTITGPTCSGKTTLLNSLLKSGEFKAVVSHTTRGPRQGEVNGVDYYFVDESTFSTMSRQRDLVEEVSFGSARYGISKDELSKVMASGKIPAIIVEPDGKNQVEEFGVRNHTPVRSVYIGGDILTLTARYLQRSSEADFSDKTKCDIHASRLVNIANEIGLWQHHNYYLRLWTHDENNSEVNVFSVKQLMDVKGS